MLATGLCVSLLAPATAQTGDDSDAPLMPAPAATLQAATPPAATPPTIISQTVDKSAVSIYRDPDRRPDQSLNLGFLRGFALISEKRTISVPKGPATIRFDGVAEGMIAVSAIVTDLPGGTVQKNRDKAILSPAALVDGSLGNRVTLQRTNPGTGALEAIDAIVRSVANQGLVLETPDGFETLRCSGLPETLTFGQIPQNLSARPVLSVETVSPMATTVQVTLTYLASGFDWSAYYVAQMADSGQQLDLTAWLTLANSNDQIFADADLVVIAGTLNVAKPFYQLADKPNAAPLRLRCFPLGSTAKGSIPPPPPPPPSPAAPMMAEAMEDGAIMVTASRISAKAPSPVTASQEDLGDLKLYRVPFRSDVAANGQKQVAFAVKDDVRVQRVYKGDAAPYTTVTAAPMAVELQMVNTTQNGLGLPLPSGGFAVFETAFNRQLLLGEAMISDYPEGADVELIISRSNQVRLTTQEPNPPTKQQWQARTAKVSNANPFAIEVEVDLGEVAYWNIRRQSARTRTKDGLMVWIATIPANDSRELRYQIRDAGYQK